MPRLLYLAIHRKCPPDTRLLKIQKVDCEEVLLILLVFSVAETSTEVFLYRESGCRECRCYCLVQNQHRYP